MQFGGHKWDKQNLMTLGKSKFYDLYKCRCCGLEGKSYHLGYITIRNSDVNKMKKCTCSKTFHKRIRVTNCTAFGPQFHNITPGSIHEIVTPPTGKTSERGEWVMGVGEPVLLLAGEYVYMED